MIDIRHYRDSDLTQLRNLLVEFQTFERQYDPNRAEPTEEFVTTYLSRLLAQVGEQQGVIFVAVEDSTVCGLAAGYVEEEAANQNAYFYIAEFVVAEAYRGRGIGSGLIRQIESFARRRGFKRLGIGVLAGSDRVHELYKRLGFRDYAVELMKEL
jgi:ribosomal protein S18 acetylase RimI-like enzyme